MSVAPSIEAPPPTFTAPPPPPPQPVGPSQVDLDAARKGYADRLARAIAQHKQYPRVAQMRGWQGETIIDLKLDRNGGVLATRIDRSSGFEVLDKQALEMVKKAAPFPAPPEILKSDVFNIQVPVSFKLE
jgi:periplasmic protein TonB